MITSVLVPLDGSELAEEALSYAVPIAKRHDASIYLVYVISRNALASDEDEAREYLDQVSARVELDSVAQLRIGDPADEIINAADELDDALVVMTTHGRTGVGRWIYGSVADKVVHAADAPVLLLRSGTSGLEVGGIRRIVVPLDGSAYSEAALTFAGSIAKTFDSELHVVRVAETANLYSTLGYETYAPGVNQPMADVVEQMIADIHKYISEVSGHLQEQGHNVQGVVLEGFAGEELLAYEKRVEPDLIVMATRGRSGFDRFIFGSVAERVLKKGETPVLMIKPAGTLVGEDE